MASNISVAITVDNKQYIAGVRAADSATKTFATDTERNLNRVNASFDNFTRRVGGLRTALAGLAFGVAGRGALAFADNLVDLSKSSGIAAARLIEFQNALATSGGEAESLPQAINTLLRSIDEAAGGSVKAQNSFKRLGIDLKDLGALSEEDLLKRTLEGIAAIENPSRRAAEMMDKFGKSFKTVDPQELLDKLNATAGSADKYVISIQRAAELNDQLTTAQNNLKLAFIEAFSGPIQKLVELNTKTGEATTGMDKLITAIKLVGLALATSFAVSGARALVAAFGQIARALTIVLGLSKGMGGIFAAGGSLMVGIRGVAVLIAALGTSIYAASQLFDDFGKIAVNALARIVEEMGRFAASILNLPTDAIAGILKMLGVKIDNPFGLGDGLNKLVDQAEKARKDAEYIQKIGRGRGSAEGRPQATPGEGVAVATGRGVLGTTSSKDPRPVRDVDKTATENALRDIRELGAEFEKQRALVLNKLDLETQLVGKTQEEKQLLEARNQLSEDFVKVQDQLIKKRDSLNKDDKEQGVQAAAINAQLKKNAEAYTGQAEALDRTIVANQHALMLEKNRQQEIKNIVELMEQQARAQEEIAGFQSQQDAARISAFEQLDAQKQQFDILMRREELERGILNLREQDKTAAMQIFELENDRKRQLEDIRKIQNLPFEGVGGMKQRLQEVNDLYDARLVRIKQTQARTTEEQNSFSFGWAQATEKFNNSITTNAEYASKTLENFTKGIEDVFVKFVQTGKLSFKDLANSMIADFARIQARRLLSGAFGDGGSGSFFGNILGSIGSIFGGGMANGGQVQGNTAFVVGERGPELFVPQNAGKIVPNNKLGSMGGGETQVINNAVTYSIQAVDAQSFRSLLARDPEFIHNVVEQGRRSLPMRSRR